jgi:hypothetical protein
MTPFWFDTITITAGATAVSLLSAITDSSLINPFVPGGGQVVSLNFAADKDMRIGFSAASVDADEGGVLAADTSFTDSATGVSGNTIPLSQIYLFAPLAGGDVTVTVYVRAIQ